MGHLVIAIGVLKISEGFQSLENFEPPDDDDDDDDYQSYPDDLDYDCCCCTEETKIGDQCIENWTVRK
jgi:hypothetical protein